MTGVSLTMIVTNARIGTGDPARPWATALGIRDGTLAVVGSAAEILKMASDDTRIIDAGSQLLTLPTGIAVGSRVIVSVGPGGHLMVHSFEDGS